MLSSLRPALSRAGVRSFTTTPARSDVARLTLVGRIVTPPVVKQTKNGKDFLIYKVATTNPYIPALEGEEQKEPGTSFHSIFAYGPSVEKLANLETGSLVMAEASFTVENVKTEEGDYKTNFFAKHQKLSVLARPRKHADAESSE